MPDQNIDDRSGQRENMSDSEERDPQKQGPQPGNRNNERKSQDQPMNSSRNEGQRGNMPSIKQQGQEEKLPGYHSNPFPGDERDTKELERKRSSNVEIDDEDAE